MTVLRGKIYVTLRPVEDRAGNITGFTPGTVTARAPSRAATTGNSVPIELDIEIDAAVFQPLKVSGGTIQISAPVPSSVGVIPPPPTPPTSPTTVYGQALARAKGS